MTDSYTIALAGNPNSGKTTVFNRLTGAHQHVGNYPGVTVDIKEGTRRHDGLSLKIVDLPGTYSLTALSDEELVARNFILEHNPDVVIDIIDASTLERQLYLAVQLIELGVPLVFAFNMSDVAERKGFQFDIPLLSELLGVPIVPTIGPSGEGIDKLLDVAVGVAKGETEISPKPFSYGRDLDGEIERITEAVEREKPEVFRDIPSKWIALKLLEEDSHTLEKFEVHGGMPDGVARTLKEAKHRLGQLFSDPPDILIAEARYGIISGAASEAVSHTIERRHSFSDRLDTVFINPVIGLPIFLILMYFVFTLTFRLGNPFIGLLENFFGWLGAAIAGLWPEGAESPLKSLLVDGIIGGVGGVLTFVPTILILFLAIAFLEDSGYMARAAFIMDRLMHRIGLHGKSFIPMLIGFGCSVPAIMGTRILENPRDRLVTILVIPLMSCSARLPIYALIIPAFFPQHLHGPMLWLIYLIGIVLAVLLTKLLRNTLFRGESTPFVMELPPYRIPTFSGLAIHAWERGAMYLRKAGTLILAISIILWWASSYPKPSEYSENYSAQREAAEEIYEERTEELAAMVGTSELDGMVEAVINIRGEFHRKVREYGLEEDTPEYLVLEDEYEEREADLEEENPALYEAAAIYIEDVETSYENEIERIENKITEEELTNSVAGRFVTFIEPILKPMGFDWKIGTALIGALAAKEVFVAQMGIVYAVGETEATSETLRRKLQENYNPLIGFCIMLFVLISAPCIATLAMTRAETHSWGWAFFQFFGLTAVAWIVTTIVYQVGSSLGWGV